MTLLQVMPEADPATIVLRSSDEDEIRAALAECSVTFTRWALQGNPPRGAAQEDVLALYREEVRALSDTEGLPVVDVAQLRPEPGEEWVERARSARSTFLEEHRHGENEVRFFAHGSGCFYLHVNGRVYAMVCSAGDLLSVPAGTRHWFDMGAQPDFVAIRFFENKDGWVGDFTGDPIARHFPDLDELLAGRR
jgi:1,2-dihydroxy-3-keto-5-methylthiopentene dioxygenase